ncbi:hypothetical protein ACF0H5_011803 [Mactra antiquata]
MILYGQKQIHVVGVNIKAAEKSNKSGPLINEIIPDITEYVDYSKPLSEKPEYTTGESVAALYGDEVYIGKIIDLDEESIQVTFMENGSKN